MMTRSLYRWLIFLHPPAFRLRFEEELLWIFDESREASGAASLLYDAALSLLRQWLVRSGMWSGEPGKPPNCLRELGKQLTSVDAR